MNDWNINDPGDYPGTYCKWPRVDRVIGSYCEYPRRSACPIVRVSLPMAATLPLGRVYEGEADRDPSQ